MKMMDLKWYYKRFFAFDRFRWIRCEFVCASEYTKAYLLPKNYAILTIQQLNILKYMWYIFFNNKNTKKSFLRFQHKQYRNDRPQFSQRNKRIRGVFLRMNKFKWKKTTPNLLTYLVMLNIKWSRKNEIWANKKLNTFTWKMYVYVSITIHKNYFQHKRTNETIVVVLTRDKLPMMEIVKKENEKKWLILEVNIWAKWSRHQLICGM